MAATIYSYNVYEAYGKVAEQEVKHLGYISSNHFYDYLKKNCKTVCHVEGGPEVDLDFNMARARLKDGNDPLTQSALPFHIYGVDIRTNRVAYVEYGNPDYYLLEFYSFLNKV